MSNVYCLPCLALLGKKLHIIIVMTFFNGNLVSLFIPSRKFSDTNVGVLFIECDINEINY